MGANLQTSTETTQKIQPCHVRGTNRVSRVSDWKDFTVLGEAAGADGCRRFQVKLALEQPQESILVAYYVFGQGPIWVYRAEEFEMIMRMDSMNEAASPSGLKDESKAKSEHLKHTPPIDASEMNTGSRPSP